MIFGIGTDIVSIPRIEQLLASYGKKLPARLLTKQEMLAYGEHSTALAQAQFLAKRFAAKEAVVKALGLGFSAKLTLKHVEVSTKSQESRQPHIELHGYALEFMRQQGKKFHTHLSLADDYPAATAMVVIEVE